MLKQRVLTALVLAPLVIWGIFALPDTWFKVFLSSIVFLAAWEWARFAGLNAYMYRLVYALINIAVVLVLNKYIESNDQYAIRVIAGFILLWWFATLFLLITYLKRIPIIKIKMFSTAVAGIPILAGTYFSLLLLRQNYGAESIMILFVLVWGADTAAYFSGKKFGKHKLLPNISPGKSIEGVIGAFAVTLISGYITSLWFNISGISLLGYLFVCIFVVLFSIVGDLNESLYKRRAKLKDSSNILPGHGGIMDRIDSLTAASPVFLYGLWLLKI